MLYLYIVCILIAETTAITFLKKFSDSKHLLYFVLGIAFYTVVSFFLVKSFKYEEMGIVNVLWSAFSVLFVVGAGMFFFGEKVSLIEVVAMALIMVGVVILRYH